MSECPLWPRATILKGFGHEPILQMVTRDRNRIALQSDLFGAYALGIRNVLCLTGDHHSFGNQKEAVGVFDLDSIQLSRTVRDYAGEGKIIGGEDIQAPPKMFIGAAENPFADPVNWRVVRLAKKVEAGADFIQTQCIFNVDRFAEFMNQAEDMGLTEKVSILAGITPLKSVGNGQVHGHQGRRDGSSRGADQPDVRRSQGKAGG